MSNCKLIFFMGILDLTMNFCLNDLCSFYIVQLNENEFSGQIPTEIGLLSSLQQMWMSFNYFNGTLFDEIQNISTLKSLSVNNNNMTGTLPISSTNHWISSQSVIINLRGRFHLLRSMKIKSFLLCY